MAKTVNKDMLIGEIIALDPGNAAILMANGMHCPGCPSARFETLEEGIDYRVSGTLKETDYIMNNSFWIGVYPGMSKEKLDFMIKNIRDFVSGTLKSGN